MEELAARASRFVSLQVGHTDKPVPSKPSNVVPLLPLQVKRLRDRLEAVFLPGALDQKEDHREAGVGFSVPRSSPMLDPK